MINGGILSCETKKIVQEEPEDIPPKLKGKFKEWDDGRLRKRMTTPTEYNWIMKCREAEATFAAEEAEFAKKGKKHPKKKEDFIPPKPQIPPNEKEEVQLEEPLPEPPHSVVPNTEKAIPTKIFAKIDGVKYECDTTEIYFKSTMMYTARTFTFKMKNTSIIHLNYGWRFIQPDTGVPDLGFYSITPKEGTIRPESEESFEVKFQPTEVEERMDRLLECLISNLDESMQPLQLEVDAEAERPICHFELPHSNYLDSKGTDITANIDKSKLKVIEFESLGVKVRNTKRFYVVNPTAQGYDFEWKKLDTDS